MRTSGSGSLLEAFKPGTAPPDSYGGGGGGVAQGGGDDQGGGGPSVGSGTGGLY
jgi:penicillin-binding protein 1A